MLFGTHLSICKSRDYPTLSISFTYVLPPTLILPFIFSTVIPQFLAKSILLGVYIFRTVQTLLRHAQLPPLHALTHTFNCSPRILCTTGTPAGSSLGREQGDHLRDHPGPANHSQICFTTVHNGNASPGAGAPSWPDGSLDLLIPPFSCGITHLCWASVRTAPVRPLQIIHFMSSAGQKRVGAGWKVLHGPRQITLFLTPRHPPCHQSNLLLLIPEISTTVGPKLA